MNSIKNTLKRNFSQIPNELITDKNLCNGSLRVILYLFTKPDNWRVYNHDICKNLNMSEQTLTKYWKKLLDSGWLQREKSRDESGKLTGGFDYLIGDFTISIKSTEQVKSMDHSNTKLSKQEYIYTFDEFKAKFPFITKPAFDKLVAHLKSKYSKLTKVRISNNIKKLKENPDLFIIAVDKMVELDYSGLFVPTRQKEIKEFTSTIYFDPDKYKPYGVIEVTP